MAGLDGIERLKERMPKKEKVVEAKVAGLGDVTFRRYEPVAFLYEGQLRTGVVKRIDQDAVLLEDDDRRSLRRFRDDKIEGRPI